MKQFIVVFTTGFLLLATVKVSSQSMPKWKVEQLQDYFSKKSDTVYVINFWATFCRPCVAELPYLQTISQKYADKKVKLLLVSLDLPESYPEKIAAFAKNNNINAAIIWLNETNADHFCPVVDKKWSGSIPSTLFINPATGYRKFFEEEMKPENFEAELQKAISPAAR